MGLIIYQRFYWVLGKEENTTYDEIRIFVSMSMKFFSLSSWSSMKLLKFALKELIESWLSNFHILSNALTLGYNFHNSWKTPKSSILMLTLLLTISSSNTFETLTNFLELFFTSKVFLTGGVFTFYWCFFC